MIKVTVIIPVKNEEEKAIRALRSFKKNVNILVHFIVVDDNSSDRSYENISSYLSVLPYGPHLLLKNDTGKPGAGVCRNLGIGQIPQDSDYVFFFDADDTMPENALSEMVEAAERYKSDVVIGQYDCFITDDNSIGLLERDSRIWQRIIRDQDEVLIQPKKYPDIFRMANFPWNKLIKYKHLMKIQLRFGESIVHNDILAHWKTLINTESVLLLKVNVCNHYVLSGNNQITNISDKRRMAIFEALEEVEEILKVKNNEEFRVAFLAFKNDVLSWAYELIDFNQRDDFKLRWRNSLKSLTYEDLLLCSLYDIDVAIKAGKAALGLEL